MCSTCSFAARPLLWGRCLSCFEHILRSCSNASYPFAWFQAEVVVCTVWGSMIPPGTGDNCTGHCLAGNSAPATEWGGDDGDALPTSGKPGNGEGVSSAQGQWGVPRSRTVRNTLQLPVENFEDVFKETMFSFVPFSLSQVNSLLLVPLWTSGQNLCFQPFCSCILFTSMMFFLCFPFLYFGPIAYYIFQQLFLIPSLVRSMVLSSSIIYGTSFPSQHHRILFYFFRRNDLVFKECFSYSLQAQISDDSFLWSCKNLTAVNWTWYSSWLMFRYLAVFLI